MQTVTLAGDTTTYTLSLYGVETGVATGTGDFTAGASTYSEIDDELDAVVEYFTGKADCADVSPTNSDAVSDFVDAGDIFEVTFTCLYGDVAMLKNPTAAAGAVTFEETAQGDAPYRQEVQVFTCDATAARSTLRSAAARAIASRTTPTKPRSRRRSRTRSAQP